MDNFEWSAISYTLPREPSRVRVSLWRKLKKAGAVSLQQSMWLLPYTPENMEFFHGIKEDMMQNHGEALIFKATVDADSQSIIIEQFNAARNEEYGELQGQCDDFLKEIEKEIARCNFSFAEIEENEEELNKLKAWYGKIVSRDFYHASSHDPSQSMLTRCEAVLEDFCGKVYAREDQT